MGELDTLLEANNKRIKEIQDRFALSQTEVRTARDVIQEEKKHWETKMRHKDNTLAYPTYGRGLTPNMKMNTFMVQENMCKPNAKKLGPDCDPLQLSPQASVAARQRRKILSPKRQKFENNFEKFMTKKYV